MEPKQSLCTTILNTRKLNNILGFQTYGFCLDIENQISRNVSLKLIQYFQKRFPANPPTNQSNTQPPNVNQPTDRPTIRPTNYPANQSTDQSTNHLTHRPFNRPSDWPIIRPNKQTTITTTNKETYFSHVYIFQDMQHVWCHQEHRLSSSFHSGLDMLSYQYHIQPHFFVQVDIC